MKLKKESILHDKYEYKAPDGVAEADVKIIIYELRKTDAVEGKL